MYVLTWMWWLLMYRGPLVTYLPICLSCCALIGLPLAASTDRSRDITLEEFRNSSHLMRHCKKYTSHTKETLSLWVLLDLFLLLFYLLWSCSRDQLGYPFPHFRVVRLEVRGVHERPQHQVQRHCTMGRPGARVRHDDTNSPLL